ncbi:MAG: SdpI family protein [Hungatella hathewayi]|nr:SdpI family protein [Hungatella hathewayi]
MGFWIFLFIMNLLIPATMIGFGKSFQSHAPKEINSLFGYRTSMSMKNRDTWEFAHHYCGKLWWQLGWGVLAFTVVFMITALGKDDDTASIYAGIISAVQIVFLLLPIYFVEKALRKNFDKDGKKRL